jgi:hypothetical protein
MARAQGKLSDAAKRLAKQGAAKGGRARAKALTQAERSEIGRQAARARWAKDRDNEGEAASVPKSTEDEGPPLSMYRGALTIGNVTFECHVLSDFRRVLTQREVVRVLTGGRESGNIQRYLQRHPLVDETFLEGRTIHFRIPGTPSLATGYEATVLVELCNTYLEAREQGLLKSSQAGLAKSAEIFIRASAKVGIIALIDEATGYQRVRERRALQIKLQAFIAEEMQEWARMFPEEFWYELARLEGVHYSAQHRPLRWGKYVMYFVYDAIDPDVGRELRSINPNPRFLKNHHQWLKKFGRERVHDQITRVVTIMKLCEDMPSFRRQFAKVFQRSPLQLTFDDFDWAS